MERTHPVTGLCKEVETNAPGSAIFCPRLTRSPTSTIATAGAPIERFVVFRGTSRERAEQALRSVGLPVRVRAPEPTTPEPTTPEPISPLASPSWAEAWGEADKVPTN